MLRDSQAENTHTELSQGLILMNQDNAFPFMSPNILDPSHPPVREPVEVNEGDGRVEGDLPEADQGTRRVDGHAGQDVAQLRRGVVHEHAAQGEALNAMCLSPCDIGRKYW